MTETPSTSRSQRAPAPTEATLFGPGDPSTATSARPMPESFVSTRSVRELSQTRENAPTRRQSEGPDHLERRRIDPYLVRRASELVDSIRIEDAIEMQLALTALASTALEMWESASIASRWHQDILAAFENAVRQSSDAGKVSMDQLAGFREALNDLASDSLVKANAEVVRAQFVRLGFSAIPYGSQIEPHDE